MFTPEFLTICIVAIVSTIGWIYSAFMHRNTTDREVTLEKLWRASNTERNAISERYDRLAGEYEKILSTNRSLPEIANEESDPLWWFSSDNRDLMPRWIALNPHMGMVQPHRRHSEWTTFCANLTVLHRDCLEQTLDKLEREHHEEVS